MTPAAPVYNPGDRVVHLGHAATVTIGNNPADGWGTSPFISIAYDKAPRGHSPRKDIPASEALPART